MTLLTAVLNVPRGYGRIIRKRRRSAEVQAIVEEKALTAKQRALNEINAGFYAFAVKPLYQHISKLSTENAHQEYYLTDMAAILARAKQKVVAVKADDAHEVLGCNTKASPFTGPRRVSLIPTCTSGPTPLLNPTSRFSAKLA